jgi:hypothetical protein
MVNGENGVKLIILPRRVMTWDEFRAIAPPYSIALDGLVDDKTKFDLKGHYANFDHHGGVDRLITECTAAQLNTAIKSGLLDDEFSVNGGIRANVYANDPDQDCQLSWWQTLRNRAVRYPQTQDISERINRLVVAEDKLDRTAGMYPLHDPRMRRTMAWMFEPYERARFEGRVGNMDESQMRDLFTQIGSRIDRYVFRDGGEELPVEGNYKRIGGGTGWVMVEETGPGARMAMAAEGIKAYVSILERRADGSIKVSFGRVGPWIRFPQQQIYGRLNNEEVGIVNICNRWAGSDLTGGSPRLTGSKLGEKKLEQFIEEEVQKELRGN